MVLAGDVRENLRKMIFSYKIITVFGVRTDNIGGKFGREFVVGVIPLLVLGEKFGLLEFAYIVIISARSCGFSPIAVAQDSASVETTSEWLNVPGAFSIRVFMSNDL